MKAKGRRQRMVDEVWRMKDIQQMINDEGKEKTNGKWWRIKNKVKIINDEALRIKLQIKNDKGWRKKYIW